jgi:hypothetical protein
MVVTQFHETNSGENVVIYCVKYAYHSTEEDMHARALSTEQNGLPRSVLITFP